MRPVPDAGRRSRIPRGLCFAHFEVVWEIVQAPDDRRLIFEVEREAARVPVDLREHDDEYRHEPKGSERDSWRRAILLTAGWSRSGESAAEPERGR